MAKKLEVFQCGFCGKSFDVEKEADECEVYDRKRAEESCEANRKYQERMAFIEAKYMDGFRGPDGDPIRLLVKHGFCDAALVLARDLTTFECELPGFRVEALWDAMVLEAKKVQDHPTTLLEGQGSKSLETHEQCGDCGLNGKLACPGHKEGPVVCPQYRPGNHS